MHNLCFFVLYLVFNAKLRITLYRIQDVSDTMSTYSEETTGTTASLNSISTVQTDATSMRYYNMQSPNLPRIKANETSNPTSKELSHKILEQFNQQHFEDSERAQREKQQMDLVKKVQQQRALSEEYQKNHHRRLQNHDTMETDSYMSVIYTEDSHSGDENTERYDDETNTQISDLRETHPRNKGHSHGHGHGRGRGHHHRRHKSVDTVTTKATYTNAGGSEHGYEPSIFTDIDYNIDFENVGIKDIVWAQKLKYLKNRLIFIEEEIADLPTKHKKLDKLMLYACLEFLSINPDENMANDRLVEWWDIHKYAWLDKHDPQKEDTMLSQNWNEIGIPLTRPKGATPTHHNKTVVEDIYDNLRRSDWIDPICMQQANQQSIDDLVALDIDNDNDDKKSNAALNDDDNKSVMIPSTIKFDKSKYKDYDKRDVRSYLIDGNDFINFLRRQTTGNYARSKSGLVGYVNVSVEDKVAECTPWKLHRIFVSCVNNRIEYEKQMELTQTNDVLKRENRSKSDKIEAYRAQIQQLKDKLAEQKLLSSQIRDQYEQEKEYYKKHNPRHKTSSADKHGERRSIRKSKSSHIVTQKT